MSMKRTKARSSGSGRGSTNDDDPAPWSTPAKPEPVWADVEAKSDDAFTPFALSSRYARGDLIQHPKFGKGLVLDAETTRIEVLFKDGKKKLGHGVT